MKKLTYDGNVVILTFCVMAAFLLSACATKAPFAVSAVVPAAVGDVVVKQDKNHNYIIKIEINNLAEPNRLTPPMNAYVVWMVNADNQIKNIGQIVSSSNSKKRLNGSFIGVSSTKPVRVFITSENDASVTNSTLSQVVLTTQNL